MIHLPNKCTASEIKVHPKNWQKAGATTKTDWYIYYRFYDPLFKNRYKYGYLKILKGINREKNLEQRRWDVKQLIASEKNSLANGYNPITEQTPQKSFDLSPDTAFIKALWKAVETIQVTPKYLIDIKSIIRGLEAAAKALNFDLIPVSEITRKYIKTIFEKCGQLNPRWSARRYNSYRTVLMILFKELIEAEAVTANPVREITKRAETKKQRLTLTAEERALINEYLYKKFYTFWRALIIFFHSGARETELFNVQGKHIDLKNQHVMYTVKKGSGSKQITRPIKDIVLPLWEEMICGPEDYLFSKGLEPGAVHISPAQFGRRWKRHVKGLGKIKEGINITADLYSLKHSNTTEVVDLINEEEAAKLNAQTSTAMVVNIYDVKNKQRKDDRLKKVNNPF